MSYPIRIPWLLTRIYPQRVWDLPAEGGRIYLSFDDGPHPEATPLVLDLLASHHAKATFFCIGRNVQLYPEIYQRILDEGHAVGNHSYSHVNGWRTATKDYVEDVSRARTLISSRLFRPPYGRIRGAQARSIRRMDMKLVMWSLLSGDFDEAISGEQCAANVLNKMRPGDVIVFHDSRKALPRLSYALPLVLDSIRERRWITEKMG